MKTFNEFEQEINEGVSDIVYHGTSIERAIKILETDRFKLSDSSDDESDFDIQKSLGRGKRYFLSTARSSTSPYIQDLDWMADSDMADVIFTLDGRKFNQRYHGSAVDYSQGTYAGNYGNELEDRINNKSPFIKGAHKYIKEIHILNKHDDSAFLISKLSNMANKRNIPVYIYMNQKDWTVLNKRKAQKR